MYPDLSYLFHDLFGTQPDNWLSIAKTFGFMMVMAFLAAAYILYIELKRKERLGVLSPVKIKQTVGAKVTPGELAGSGIWGFILGFKLSYVALNFEIFKADPAGTLLSLKGMFVPGLLAGVVFSAYKYWEGKKKELPKPKTVIKDVYPHDRVGDMTVIAAISGIIGAKIFDVLENLPAFFADPVGMLLSGSGLAIYGGLIGGFLGVTWFARKHHIPFWHLADAVAPALIIAYGIGRIGCQLSGDGDWGIVNNLAQPAWWFLPDWMWAFDYPHNVLNEGVAIEGCDWHYCHRLREAVFPTPFYETVMAFLIGGFLWIIRKRIKITGVLFFIYLILNGFERFWIEKIRVNRHYDYFGLHFTQAEFIATLFFIIGIAGIFLLWKKQKKETVV